MTTLQEKEAILEIIRLAKEQKSGVKFLMEMEYYSEHKMDFHREQYKTAKKQLKIARELRSKITRLQGALQDRHEAAQDCHGGGGRTGSEFLVETLWFWTQSSGQETQDPIGNGFSVRHVMSYFSG